MHRPKFVVLASVWNEANFLPAWLLQLDEIAPDEVLIAEGCFDNSLPRPSTDDSRGILETWVEARPNAKLFDVRRESRRTHILTSVDAPRRYPVVAHRFTSHSVGDLARSTYRLNQSATFTWLLSQSRVASKDTWIMTLDVDEFYPPNTLSLLTMRHFPRNNYLMPMYERRFLSVDTEVLLPHHVAIRTHNVPTRIVNNGVRFVKTRQIISTKGLRSVPLVPPKTLKIERINLPIFFHYQTRASRRQLALTLGDRQPPPVFPTVKRAITHPQYSPYR